MTVHIGQSSIKAVVSKRQLRVIQSEQMQDGRIKVMDRQDILHSLESKFVRHAMTDAAFNASSGEDRCEAVRIMISSERAFLKHRHAAELCAPDDQRIFQ